MAPVAAAMNRDKDFLLEFVLVFVSAPELPLLQMVIMNYVDTCNVAVFSTTRFYWYRTRGKWLTWSR
jgi:hypothetical protein